MHRKVGRRKASVMVRFEMCSSRPTPWRFTPCITISAGFTRRSGLRLRSKLESPITSGQSKKCLKEHWASHLEMTIYQGNTIPSKISLDESKAYHVRYSLWEQVSITIFLQIPRSCLGSRGRLTSVAITTRILLAQRQNEQTKKKS